MKYIMYMHSLKSFQFIEWVNKINDLKRVEHLVIQFFEESRCNNVSFIQKHSWFNLIINLLSMLISLIHHLFSCFDQSFISEDQCLVYLFKYILDLINLQVFASAFILDDVRVEAHTRMKVLVHEEENQEDDWEQDVIVDKLDHE